MALRRPQAEDAPSRRASGNLRSARLFPGDHLLQQERPLRPARSRSTGSDPRGCDTSRRIVRDHRAGAGDAHRTCSAPGRPASSRRTAPGRDRRTRRSSAGLQGDPPCSLPLVASLRRQDCVRCVPIKRWSSPQRRSITSSVAVALAFGGSAGVREKRGRRRLCHTFLSVQSERGALPVVRMLRAPRPSQGPARYMTSDPSASAQLISPPACAAGIRRPGVP